jgi:hypothetical protein
MFAWLLSAIFLNKSIKLLQVQKKHRDLALLIYALIPSSILFTSVTLREVYQLLFVNIFIFSSLMILIKRKIFFGSYYFCNNWHGRASFWLSFICNVGALLTLYFTSIKRNRILSIELIIFYIPILSLLSYLGVTYGTGLFHLNLKEG